MLIPLLLAGLVVTVAAQREGRAAKARAESLTRQPVPGNPLVRLKIIAHPPVPCFVVPNSRVQAELAKAGIVAEVWSDPAQLPHDWPRDERGQPAPSGCTFFAQGTAPPNLVPAELAAFWRT